jgi:hypothetical protein
MDRATADGGVPPNQIVAVVPEPTTLEAFLTLALAAKVP